MLRRFYAIGLLLFITAACQPANAVNAPPTAIPFPTMTPGRVLRGLLPTLVGLPLDGSGLANPATAVALANQPTPAPDYAACPPPGSPTLTTRPSTGSGMADAIARFLSEGGSPEALADGLRDDWAVLGDTGAVKSDVDFNGGTPEVLATYRAPEGGRLLILGCLNRLYAPLYEAATSEGIPEIVYAGDINFDGQAELLFSSQECSGDGGENCAHRTQLLTWRPEGGRFVSLLNGNMTSADPPTLNDVDDDQVAEIVVRLTDPGSASTGPLRTGVHIYDWNGAVYTLSIIQLDAPRFKIQVIHEADRAFARQETDSAISLYTLARTDNNLRFWLNDEPAVLDTYTFYRLVLLYAFTEDADLLPTYQAALQAYPDPAAAPVYIEMLNAFWNAFQVTHNLHSACLEVAAITTAKPEAVNLLNRYGSRSPVYNADDLCPF